MKKALFLLVVLLAACGSKSSSSSTPQQVFLLSPPSGSGIASGAIGVVYTQTFTIVSGGTPPYAVGALNVPGGLTITQTSGTTFTLSGKPTQAGSGLIQIQVADSAQHAEVEQYFIAITGANALTVSPATLAPFQAGAGYSQAVTATGTPPITWTVGGNLPPGVTLAATQTSSNGNTISGTPTRTGTYAFTLAVSDAAGATGQQSYTVTVN